MLPQLASHILSATIMPHITLAYYTPATVSSLAQVQRQRKDLKKKRKLPVAQRREKPVGPWHHFSSGFPCRPSNRHLFPHSFFLVTSGSIASLLPTTPITSLPPLFKMMLASRIQRRAFSATARDVSFSLPRAPSCSMPKPEAAGWSSPSSNLCRRRD